MSDVDLKTRVLRSWTTLNAELHSLSEGEVRRCILLENRRDRGVRNTFVNRLTKRLMRLAGEKARRSIR